MEIIFSEEFSKKFKRIKNKDLRLKIMGIIRKLKENPQIGKPLNYDLKGNRTIRIPPFRIIYEIIEEKINIITIHHRKNVYK